MNKQKIEQATASLAITFLTIATIAVILLIADQFFNWDLFPPSFETALGFILVSMGLIIFSSVIVNIMLNISLIAATLQEFTHDRRTKKTK